MHRRALMLGLFGLGAVTLAGGAAEAAMPVAPAPVPEPIATTAEVKPGRDVIPSVENARVVVVRRRRRVVVVRRRPVVVVRRRPRVVVVRRRRRW
jgi:hypothetical protein